MVHRPTDSRLLANLISHEKDYSKHLQTLLDTSHASYNSLTAYASASPPPASQVVLAVASSLYNADEALRGYAVAVEQWRQYLVDLKELEDELGNIMRDREILVTRLLKASKSSKPSSNRDSASLSPPLSQAYHSSSTLSLKSSTEDPSMAYAPSPSFLIGATNISKKLQSAQAQLQACEAHLALKEKELDVKRTSAVREGLRLRFRALADCGWRWTQVGKEVQAFLGEDQDAMRSMSSSPRPPLSRPMSQIMSSPDGANKPLPLPEIHTPVPIRPVASPQPLPQSERPSSDLSSIAPSQSASQVNVPIASPAPSPLHIYSDLEAVSQPSTHSTQPSFNLTVPPAHAIEETTMPTSTRNEPQPQRAISPVGSTSGSTSYPAKRHVLAHRITEEDLGFSDVMLNGEGNSAIVLAGNVNKEQPSAPQAQDDGGSSDEDPGTLSPNVTVVENPRYRKSGSTSVLGIPPSPKKEKGGLFGSIRGLFTRHGKDSSTGSIDDDGSVGSTGGRGRKQRKPLFGRKDNRWDTRTDGNVRRLTSSSEDEGPKLSPLKSLFPRQGSPELSLPHNALGLSSSPSRGRVMSDVGTATPTASSRRLRKKSVKGKAVDDQDITETQRKQMRRRSASFDEDILHYGNKRAREEEENIVDLDIREERLSRAEEWVDSQKQHSGEQKQVESNTLPQSLPEAKKGIGAGTAKRKKSVKKPPALDNTQPSRPSSPSSPTNDVFLVPVSDGGQALSRNSSLSAASAPPLPTSTSRVRRTTLTPSSASVSALPTHAPSRVKKHQKSGSVDDTAVSKMPITTTTTTTKAQRRASSPLIFPEVREGSTSLMSIVEDVARQNREAWDSGGARKSIGGTVKPVGLLELEIVKAPKSVSAKELETMTLSVEAAKPKSKGVYVNGKNSHSAPVLEIPKAPGSMFDKQQPPILVPGPSTSRTDLVSPTPAPIIPQAKRPAVSPLRSALKSPSRTPSPMPHLPPPVEEKRETRAEQNPSPPPSLPPSSMPNGHANPSERAVSPPPQAPHSDDSGSDAASLSSYETGHEVLYRDDPVSETNVSQLSPPLPEKDTQPPPSNSNGLLMLPDRNPHGDLSDLSASTVSTEVVNQNLAQAQAQAQARTLSGASTPDSGSQPRRRKSVRVSLQPTFSPTPPAIEDDDEPPPWETSWNSGSHKSNRGGDDVRDVWDDSSSEDIEYSRARSLLSKLSKKEKKGS
ncbi:hypothetical protein Moror_2178 [Moniliophthora roreri MCA 2997]|uniref:Uncharacterized protein n=2 Tax=Moniliophthora roreri TaxID=221103 RepID=V2WA44_MONRO|nr:hypothetical protein Moror_2178 [Moniliophthora roreri MCA 2997]KAI3601430.1 hypothetical protein WG66_002523 [Moniliophthora roreri]